MMWKKYEDFGNTLENINRVASFKKDLAKGKCTKLPAQIVVRKLKFLLNQKKADLFIAETATRNIESFRFYASKFSV